MGTPCPGCGQEHQLPFDERVLELYHEFEAAENETTRERIIDEIALAFSSTIGVSDPSFSEAIHDLVERYNRANLEMQSSSAKLGRAIVRVIESYEHQLKALSLIRQAISPPPDETKSN